MTDERLNELLADAAKTYRVPPEPDLEGIWREVEREAFSEPARRRLSWWRTPSWPVLAMAAAASLALGVGLGRVSSPRVAGAPVIAASPAAPSAELPAGYDRTATELLGKTVILLAALPAERGRDASVRFSSQASEMLSTTRLLLDSPAASDPRFKELLQDLELVLAQIARLHGGRGPEEIELIKDAVEERDVVPRIHSAVARLSLGDN
jgi:hypothetical protein